jgi:hypothetical protein
MHKPNPEHRFFRWFEQAWQFEHDWRTKNQMNYEYYDGDQWSADALSVLEERQQAPIVMNSIRPTVDSVVSQFMQRQTDVVLSGRQIEDDQTSQLMTELVKQVFQFSAFEMYESAVFREGLIGGIGWMEIGLREDDQVFVEKIDWNDVWVDPYARKPDISDARYVMRQVWMDADQLVAEYPEAEDVIFDQWKAWEDSYQGQEYEAQSTGGGNESPDIYDHRSRRAVVFETWYRDKSARIRYVKWVGGIFLEGGEKDENNDNLYRNEETGEELSRFPLVPFVCSRSTKGHPQGLVQWIMSLQDSMNHLISKYHFLISSKQVIAEEGAIPDIDQFREQLQDPTGIAMVETGMLGKIKEVEHTSEAAHIAQMLQMVYAQMQRTSGVNDASIGVGGVNARSAQQETTRLLQGANMQSQIINSAYFAKRNAAEVIIELIGLFYTKERVLKIKHDSGKVDNYPLNQEFMGKDGEMGFYNVADILQFDVVVKHVQQFDSVRQYFLTSIAEFAKAGAIPPQVASRLLITYGDVPNKQELIQEIESFYAEQRELDQAQQAAEIESTQASASPGVAG